MTDKIHPSLTLETIHAEFQALKSSFSAHEAVKAELQDLTRAFHTHVKEHAAEVRSLRAQIRTLQNIAHAKEMGEGTTETAWEEEEAMAELPTNEETKTSRAKTLVRILVTSATFRVKTQRVRAAVAKKLLPLRNRTESLMIRLTREAVLQKLESEFASKAMEQFMTARNVDGA